MPTPPAIQNPQLNSLVYDVLFNMPTEHGMSMPKKFVKPCTEDKYAKRFAKSAALEQKLELLSYAGLRWFFIVANEENLRVKDLRALLANYKDNKKYAALKSITTRSIFVTSDKEFLQLLGLIAQSSSTGAYAYDFNYNRTGYSAKKWDTTLPSDEAEEFEAMKKEKAKEVQVAQNLILNYLFSSTNFDISSDELLLLTYFYQRPNVYIPFEEVIVSWKHALHERIIISVVRRLASGKYIQKHITEKTYTITGLGIDKINRFMKKAITI